jgi:hypothetical protein
MLRVPPSSFACDVSEQKLSANQTSDHTFYSDIQETTIARAAGSHLDYQQSKANNY